MEYTMHVYFARTVDFKVIVNCSEQAHPYSVRVRNVGLIPHNDRGIPALAGHPEPTEPISAVTTG